MIKKKNLVMDDFLSDAQETVRENATKKLEQKQVVKLEQKSVSIDGKVKGKEKGSEWRKHERPVQKTIHFDAVLNEKINLLKQIEGVAVQDLIYNIVKEWMDINFEKKKKEWLKRMGG